jgi:glycosyltransferase involved in cell wall biosynthesis
VDTTHFTPARRSASLRERWRVSADRPALLYVGRVSREKGLHLLPAIGAALEARGLRHRLVIAGDGPMRRELAAACPDAVFLGSLGRDAVADAFASADLFVFPSTTDTAGNVVLEAQASGLPVVVSDRGGPRENIDPDSSGLVAAIPAPRAGRRGWHLCSNHPNDDGPWADWHDATPKRASGRKPWRRSTRPTARWPTRAPASGPSRR